MYRRIALLTGLAAIALSGSAHAWPYPPPPPSCHTRFVVTCQRPMAQGGSGNYGQGGVYGGSRQNLTPSLPIPPPRNSYRLR